MIRKKTMKHLSQPNNARPIIRKHLNADALFQGVYNDFSKISDFRLNNIKISIEDALMSGFAMFSLKDPSLLAFDERRGVDLNLNTIYGIGNVPCDTQMRTIPDLADPEELRASFKGPLRQLQGSPCKIVRIYKINGLHPISVTGQ